MLICPLHSLVKCLHIFCLWAGAGGLTISSSMSFEDSLYVLGTNALSDMWFATIISLFVACLLVLISFAEQASNFDVVIKFLLYESCFWLLYLRIHCLTEGHKDFSVLFWKFLNFSFKSVIDWVKYCMTDIGLFF